MERSLQRDSIPTNRIERYMARMPSLPVTVNRVMEICNSPSTSPYDLNRVISLDPVLTGQVLRLVNSAYYGLRNEVTSLPRAIIMLGMNTIKNLVVSSAILSTMSGRDDVHALDMDAFWLHSLSAAVAAKRLAACIKIPAENQEEYFVGGLLHDLGKIPLNSLFPSEYAEIMAEAPQKGTDLCEKERKFLGIDHTQVGGMIAEKWKLGVAIEDCLRLHHESLSASERNVDRVRIVALADLCARRFGPDNAGTCCFDEEAVDMMRLALSIDQTDLDDLRETMADEIEKAMIFLHIAGGDHGDKD